MCTQVNYTSFTAGAINLNCSLLAYYEAVGTCLDTVIRAKRMNNKQKHSSIFDGM